jgi:site-specific DNA recombinase
VWRRKLSDAADGKPAIGGHRPFGYRLGQGGTLILLPDEASLIREASQRLLAGDTLGGICREWQLRGITTPTGRPWMPTPLRNSLKRIALTGYRNHPVAGPKRGTWPAILPKEEWDRLQLVLDNPSRLNHGRVNARSYLLTGLVYCALCDQPLRGSLREGGSRTYSCRKAVGFRGCGRIRRRADSLEVEVIERVLYRLDSPHVRAALSTSDESADSRDWQEIQLCKNRLQQFADDYADGTFKKDEYLRQKARYEERMAGAQRRLKRRQASYAMTRLSTDPVRQQWESEEATFEWKRALLNATIRKIVVHPQRVRCSTLTSSRSLGRHDRDTTWSEWCDQC